MVRSLVGQLGTSRCTIYASTGLKALQWTNQSTTNYWPVWGTSANPGSLELLDGIVTVALEALLKLL